MARRALDERRRDFGEARVKVRLGRSPQWRTWPLDAAWDVLEELEPRWLLVVGIAGGVPSDELTLGDVVVSTRIVDFSVEAVLQDKPSEFALMGGPVAKEAAVVLADLRARDRELGDWNGPTSIGVPRPRIEIDGGEFYGDEAWQAKARAGLARQAARTAPIVTAGAVGSSDRLVKETTILATFLLKAARQVLAVEMESAGVYRAATGRGVPIVAIRGLSDVVGFKRDPGWTAYACHSAASFTRAFLRTGPIEPRASAPTPPVQPASRWPAKLSGLELQELVSALLSAFPSRGALARMLRFGLDQSLDEMAGPGNLPDTVFEVVRHAEAQGMVAALFDAAHAAAPANPEILAIATKRRA
jgi:nucleoside phosphorylase